MSDESGASNLIRDAAYGLAATVAAIAGYVGSLSLNSARKLAEAIAKIDALRESLIAYRADELIYRVDFIRRLERLERVEEERGNEP